MCLLVDDEFEPIGARNDHLVGPLGDQCCQRQAAFVGRIRDWNGLDVIQRDAA